MVLKHPQGYVSYYNHLSRFGAGVQKGKRVAQRQIIGYVGSTGVSTGSHLDYRLSKNGRFINPLEEKFPARLSVGEKEMEFFRARKEEVLDALQKSRSFSGDAERS